MVPEGIGIHFQYGGEFNRQALQRFCNLPESLLYFIFSPAGDNPQHLFDPERTKIIHIEFDIAPEGAGAGQVTVALNWSTPEWSALGYVDSLPPVPNEAIPEESYIIRETILGDPAAMAETVEASHIIHDFLFLYHVPVSAW